MPKEKRYLKNLGQIEIDPNTGIADIKLPSPDKIVESAYREIPIRQEIGRVFEPYGGVKSIDVGLGLEELRDIPKSRAEKQTGLGLTGKFLGQLATEATLGMGEAIGYALDFEEVYNADEQAKEGFDNWFSKGFREAKEHVQEEWFPVYQTRKAQEGDFFQRLSQPTWWASQGKTIGTTLALLGPSFAVGAGATALTGGAGSGVAASMIGAMASAMFSRKAESAMEANQVFQQEYQKYLDEGITDDIARELAGKSASTVFKANAAMLPLDMMQFALLSKTLAPIKRTIDATKTTGIGKGFAIASQMGSEAIEEGYQFMAQEEAIRGVREGITPFGGGFGDRIGEYIKDPEFQTSAFMGAVTGGVFDVAGRTLGKVQERIEKNSVNKTIAANLKDIESLNKIDNNIEAELLMRAAKTNNFDNIRQSASSLAQDIQSREDLEDGEKQASIDKLNKLVENVDYLESVDDEIKKSNPSYVLNPNTRLQYLATKYEDKLNSDRINVLESDVDSILANMTDPRDVIVRLTANIRSTRLLLDRIKQDTKLEKSIKNTKVKELEAELGKNSQQLAEEVENIKTNTEYTNFNPSEYTHPDYTKLLARQTELKGAKIMKDIYRNRLAKYDSNTPEQIEREEKEIAKEQEKNILNLQREEFEKKADTVETQEDLDSFVSDVTASKFSPTDKARLVKKANNSLEDFVTEERRKKENQKVKWNKIIDEAVNERELDSIIDQMTVAGVEPDFPRINKKREELKKEAEPKKEEVKPEEQDDLEKEPTIESSPDVSGQTNAINEATETDESVPKTEKQLKEIEKAQLEADIEREVDLVASEVTIARRDKVGKKEGLKTKDVYDENGKVQLTKGTNHEIFKPDYANKGTEIILQVDTEYVNPDDSFDNYQKYKNDLNNVPIKIINKTDGKFLGYVHTLNWLQKSSFEFPEIRKELIRQTLAIRNAFLTGDNIDTSKQIESVIISKSPGWLNFNPVENTETGRRKRINISEVFKRDGKWDDRVLFRPVGWDGNIEQTDVSIANKTILKKLEGMIVAVIPSSNEQYLVEVLKQKKFKDAPPHIQKEFAHNIMGLLLRAVQDSSINWENLIEDVKKYLYPQTRFGSQIGTYLGGLDSRHNLLFNVDLFSEEKTRNLVVSITDNNNGYDVFKFENTEKGVIIKHRKRGLSKGALKQLTEEEQYNIVSQDYNAFEQILIERLGEKYLNISRPDLINPEGFKRWIADKDYNLTEKSDQDYRDFLSEIDALSTEVHGVMTEYGEITYTTQPNIVYSSDIIKSDTQEQTEKETISQTEPKTTSNVLDSDYADDIIEDSGESDFLSARLLDKASINSFSLIHNVNQENDVVNSLVVSYIRQYEEILLSEEDNKSEVTFEIILQALRERLELAEQGKLDPNPKYNAQIAKYTKLVLDNFEASYNEDGSVKFVGYRAKIESELNKLKFDPLETEFNEQDKEEISEAQFVDNKTLKTDPEKSASARIKRALVSLKLYENGRGKGNILGISKYRDYAETFNTIMEATADLPADEIYNELKELGNALEPNNVYSQVVELLDRSIKDKDTFYGEFMKVFKKQRAKFIRPLIFSNSNERPFISLYLANKLGSFGVILNKWEEQYKNNKRIKTIVEEKKDKQHREYKNLTKDFGNLWDKDYKRSKNPSEQYIKELSEFFNSIGIDVSEKAFDKLYKDYLKYPKRLTGFKSIDKVRSFESFREFIFRNFNSIIKYINEFSVEEQDENSDGLAGDIFRSQGRLLTLLARYEAVMNPSALSNSFRNANGDIIYGFVNPHHLSNTVEELKSGTGAKIEEAKSDPFSRRSTWLNDETALKDIELFYMDGARNGNSKKQAVTLENMSPLEKEQVKAALVLNKGAFSGYFLTPTPSDKTTFPLIKAPKIYIKKEDINLDAGHLKPDSELISNLYNLLVQSEIDRINTTAKLVKNAIETNNFKGLIKGEHYNIIDDKVVLGSRGYFYLIPQMNEVFADRLESAVEKGMFAPSERLEEFTNELNRLIDIKYDIWEKLGVFDRLDKNYMNDFSSPTREVAYKDKNRYATIDYTINSMAAHANQLMLITGDPASFVKPDKTWDGTHNTWQGMVDGTIKNMFKRTAKDIAPGYEGYWPETEKQYKILFVNEPEKDSKLSTEYKDKLDKKLLKGLNKIEFADAQEWTTLGEHIKSLAAFGLISQEQKQTILEKYEVDKKLNDAELGLVLQPSKPVQVGQKNIDFGEGVVQTVDYYIKTSSFPLIPQLTKGLQIDAVREFMENNGIDRLVPKTAVKTGFHKPVTITDKNGNLLIENNKLSPTGYEKGFSEHVLDRKFLRIQQDVPYNPNKFNSLEGSQFKKLKYSDLQSDWIFDLHESSYHGHELKELDDKIHTQIYKKQYQNLIKRLGLTQTPDGKFVTLNNIEKFKELVIEEAEARGFDYNDLLLLNTIRLNDTGETSLAIDGIPLFMHPALPKIEALLNSLIKNNVLITKFPGKSYVQGSSLGFDTMIEATEENLFKLKNQSDLKLLSTYRGELGYTLDKEYVEAEVLLPWYFKESIEQFTDKTTGEIDEARVDPELLELIGYRIPTQDHGSMVKLKVVGFLPKSSGDLIIVPPEITRIMGSDFDVDKLFVHSFHYRYDNTMIEKIKPKSTNVEELSMEELQNLSLDITHSILENENITERLLSPLDNDDIQDVLDYIDELTTSNRGTSKEIDFSKPSQTSVLFDQLNSQYIDINASGKTGIAIGSVASTSHVLGQYAGLYIKSYKKGSIENPIIVDNAVKFAKNKEDKAFNEEDNPDNTSAHGQEINYEDHANNGLFRLDRIFGVTGKRISQVIKNIQTESVDNANNQRLYGMNLNKNTFDVAFILAKAGLDERYIGLFLNQPIIKEYTEALNGIGDIGSTEFEAGKKEEIQKEIWNKYKTKKNSRDIPEDFKSRLVSFEEMEDSLNVNNSSKIYIGSEDYFYFQHRVLESFLTYENSAFNLNGLFRSINIDTKYLGKSVTDTVIKRQNFQDDFLNNKLIGNKEKLYDTLQMEAYRYGVIGSLQLFKNVLPYENDVNLFNTLRLRMLENLQKEKLNEDYLNNISKAIKSIIWIKAWSDVTGKNADQYRREILFGEASVAKRVNRLKEVTDNTLGKFLTVTTSNIPGVPDVVEFSGAGNVTKDFNLKMQQSWMQLYNSKNERLRQLAIDLVGYSLVNGNERTARDFARFIPFDIIRDLGLLKSVNEQYQNILLQSENLEIADIVEQQYYQHNPNRAFAGNIENFNLYQGETKTTDLSNVTSVSYKKKGVTTSKYVYFYDKRSKQMVLFKQNPENEYQLDKIPLLGNPRSLLVEYDIDNPNKTSVFTPESKKAIQDRPVVIKSEEQPEVEKQPIFKQFDFTKDSKATTVLDKIAEKGSDFNNEGLAEVAKLLKKNHGELLNTVNLVPSFDGKGFSERAHQLIAKGEYIIGEFNPATNTIAVNLPLITNLKKGNIWNFPEMSAEEFFSVVFLHEALHKITRTSKPSEELTKLFDEFKKHHSELEAQTYDKYTTNIGEFISGIFTDKNFQHYLNGIETQSGNILERLWNAIIKLISKDIQIKPNSLLAQSLKEAMEFVGSDVLKQNENNRLSKWMMDPASDFMKTKYKLNENQLKRKKDCYNL